MLGGKSSRIVVYIAEAQQEFVADEPSSRNMYIYNLFFHHRHNTLPEQDQNIGVVPNPELVPERDIEDIEPLEVHVDELVTRFN
ncbi:hypothetical protein AMTR_s00045p00057140 [Amborella trichopoda]|uniref:Uncharacterized protein n=1 Tax=Amborella trichopoda TaxID=13333 RepID=W1P2Z4_AMBTC|nr:hypothetical protein AMTR_s00045p00057140 [Amborella trichopoda]